MDKNQSITGGHFKNIDQKDQRGDEVGSGVEPLYEVLQTSA